MFAVGRHCLSRRFRQLDCAACSSCKEPYRTVRHSTSPALSYKSHPAASVHSFKYCFPNLMAVAAYEPFHAPEGAIETPWTKDIRTGVAAMTTTGGHLWNAAERLVDYMEAVADSTELTRPGVSILELGSGVGFVAMCLAANLPKASRVVATEQAEGGAVDWLLSNISRNKHLDLKNLQVCLCDWTHFDTPNKGGSRTKGCGTKGLDSLQAFGPGTARENAELLNETGACKQSSSAHVQQYDTDCGARCSSRADIRSSNDREGQKSSACAPPAAEASSGRCVADDRGKNDSEGPSRTECCSAIDSSSSEQWDFIVGSDLVYNEIGCRLLPRTLSALMSDKTKVLYAHTKRRFEMLDSDFLENLEAEGLQLEEVREPWASSPPPSPEPFASLFPDMRIVVWSISRRM